MAAAIVFRAQTRSLWLTSALLLGYAFLYMPIALLVVFSFNQSRLLTTWSGFSLRWYAALWQDSALFNAAWLSLRIALLSASVATCLGLIAGYAMARFPAFPGRAPMVLGLAAPLVMPDVLIGVSLLLLFVALGWPTRGAATIVLAHITFALSYVAVAVRARLANTDPAFEGAGADLGAAPATVFLLVTLPLLAPALLAGWLMAFTLSLDDLVVASFVSGPGATTLPMLVFSTLKLGATPELDALASVILALCAVALAVSSHLSVAGQRTSL
jgi:putrescine transport system permease protein